MTRDADFLLAVLRENPGKWIRHQDILNRSFQERGCGLTVHSRASTLRDRGYNIECKVERDWQGLGRTVSFYRLMPTLEAADPTHKPLSLGFPGSAASSVAEPNAPSPLSDNGGASHQPVAEASDTLFDLPDKPAWA